MTQRPQPAPDSHSRFGLAKTEIRVVMLIFLAITLVGGLAVAGSTGVATADTADNDSDSPPEPTAASYDDNKTGHPKVEDDLLESDSTADHSQQSTDGPVTVIVEAVKGQGAEAEDAVAEHGDINAREGTVIRAEVPRDELKTLAEDSNINFIRQPLEGQRQGEYTSEGVETVRAGLAQARGWDGNATVVVIDFDFNPNHGPIADNVVHTNDTTGNGFGTQSTTHGDATAEIVADIAPDVNLVLLKVSDYVSLLQAARYVENNNWAEDGSHLEVDAVSISLGYYGRPNDGTALIDERIDDSVANGTHWSIAAGNKGNGGHWNGTFYNPDDGDKFHNFEDNIECSTVPGPTSVILQWNDWPRSNQDYDLYLYDVQDDGLELVDRSTNVQDGSQPPWESVSTSRSGRHCYAIRNYDADGTGDFDVFKTGPGQLGHWTKTRSITVPATSQKATSVGAVSYDTEDLRSYSSQGPTIDGRVKPTLVGPDGVSSTAYEEDQYSPDTFYGTSAAAPHVAGVAALLSAADDQFEGDNITSRLRETADPLGRDTPTISIGSGLVDAATALPPQDPAATDPPAEITPENEDAVPVDAVFDHEPKPGTVAVSATGPNGNVTSLTKNVNTSSTTTTLRLNTTQLADGTLEFTASVTDTTGLSNPAETTAISTVTKDTGQRPNFTVAIDSSNAPVVASDNLHVNTTIENTGDIEDTQDTTFAINGTAIETRSLTLAGGATETVNFTYKTDTTDPPTVSVNVSSADDFETTTATVQEPANITATIDSTNGPVYVGEDLVVNTTLKNDGKTEGTQEVTFSINGSVVETQEVTLGSGSAMPANFSYTTSKEDMPQVLINVSSNDDSETRTAVIRGLQYYADDESGSIGTEDLREAIDDWRAGDIETDLLREVIDYWRSGKSVE